MVGKVGRPPRDLYKYFVVTISNFKERRTIVLLVKGKSMPECKSIVNGFLTDKLGGFSGRFIWANTTRRDFNRLTYDRGKQSIYLLSAV